MMTRHTFFTKTFACIINAIIYTLECFNSVTKALMGRKSKRRFEKDEKWSEKL